jgi:hypothetical protein
LHCHGLDRCDGSGRSRAVKMALIPSRCPNTGRSRGSTIAVYAGRRRRVGRIFSHALAQAGGPPAQVLIDSSARRQIPASGRPMAHRPQVICFTWSEQAAKRIRPFSDAGQLTSRRCVGRLGPGNSTRPDMRHARAEELDRHRLQPRRLHAARPSRHQTRASGRNQNGTPTAKPRA